MDMEVKTTNPEIAFRLIRRAMYEYDLNIKQVAARLSRSTPTVKRALNGAISDRTAYLIVKEFGELLERTTTSPAFEVIRNDSE